ncbi:hypothetical protein CTA1_11390 [Colletotrichum tanaceti]|uniref:Uncharacterized protein n=1 Tax=Colletotrichum tanaceti TaxID=1306861 RepID=A0A4U6XK16_9PEZI|nr:hypothetical protein CTA1_11390 [Colletotrichum tanaceti]
MVGATRIVEVQVTKRSSSRYDIETRFNLREAASAIAVHPVDEGEDPGDFNFTEANFPRELMSEARRLEEFLNDPVPNPGVADITTADVLEMARDVGYEDSEDDESHETGEASRGVEPGQASTTFADIRASLDDLTEEERDYHFRMGMQREGISEDPPADDDPDYFATDDDDQDFTTDDDESDSAPDA